MWKPKICQSSNPFQSSPQCLYLPWKKMYFSWEWLFGSCFYWKLQIILTKNLILSIDDRLKASEWGHPPPPSPYLNPPLNMNLLSYLISLHIKLSILVDTSQGHQYLHSRDIIHRDLFSNTACIMRFLVSCLSEINQGVRVSSYYSIY